MLFTTEITASTYHIFTSDPDHRLTKILVDHLRPLVEELVVDNPQKSQRKDSGYDLYITTPFLFSTTVSAKETIFLLHPGEAFPHIISGISKQIYYDNPSLITEKHSDLIAQFIFDTDTTKLNLNHLPPSIKPSKKRRPSSRQKYFTAILIFIFLLHTAFLVPLFIAGASLHKAVTAVQTGEISQAEAALITGTKAVRYSESLYTVARPGLSFFFLSPVFDSALHAANTGTTVLKSTITVIGLAKEIIAPKETTSATRISVELNGAVKELTQAISDLEDELVFELPPLKDLKVLIHHYLPLFEHASEITPHLDSLMGAIQKKRYVIFFLNNREQRPGGGFIGSFAEVDIQDYRITRFQIYDAYDADGKLQGHIDPPEPIRQYLQQPNWFLRDSNWAPSFEDNVKKAQFFLEKELKIEPADGYIAITESALESLLKAYRPITVAGLDTPITSDNLFFVLQQEIEGTFFAGSHTKKLIIADIAKSIMYATDKTSGELLLPRLIEILEQKQLVFYSSDAEINTTIKKVGWDGDQIDPHCIHSQNCVSDYFLLLDANLGLSKVNYWVNKTVSKILSIQKDQLIDDTTIVWENQSPSEQYPAGDYKNFARIYLDKETVVEKLSINGVDSAYKEFRGPLFKEIGFYLIVKPHSSAQVQIKTRYPLAAGNETVPGQLIIQKQIGDVNSTLRLVLNDPRLKAKNFVPVEKSGKVIYNSPLESDKLFFIDITR